MDEPRARVAWSPCLCAAAALIIGPSTSVSAAPSPPEGTYAANVFVQSVAGAGCVDFTNESFVAGEVSYGGLSAKRLVIRVPLVGPDATFTWRQVLTVTGGAGTLNPTGTVTFAGIGAISWNMQGTFSAIVNELDSHDFGLQISETYPDCSEKLQISLVRFGPNQ